MVAAYEELVRPRVMTAVEDLAAREASGVLEVTGDPSGAVYLDGGRIAFARASWVPGLAARLRPRAAAFGALAELPPGRNADDADAADDAAIAGHAVQRGYLTPAGLHELIRSIVVEAFLVLTIPLTAEPPVAGIRFTSTRTYWPELFPRLDLGLVRGEAVRRAERMARHGLAPTTAVALRDLRAPAAVLTPEQWAVACQIGEHASALDLAARRGAALCDTIDSLGSLAQAGLCGPVRVSGRGRSLPRGPGRVPPARQAGHPAGQPSGLPAGFPREFPAGQSSGLPVGFPLGQAAEPPRAERLPVRPAAPDVPSRHEWAAAQPPTADVLRQVLSGLRKLS